MPQDVDSTVFLRPVRDRRQAPDRRAHWRGGRRGADFSSTVRDLAARVVGEYAEQPSLMLTLPQAARLFGTDLATCDGVFRMLTQHGTLLKTPTDRYVAFRVRQARATLSPPRRQQSA